MYISKLEKNIFTVYHVIYGLTKCFDECFDFSEYVDSEPARAESVVTQHYEGKPLHLVEHTAGRLLPLCRQRSKPKLKNYQNFAKVSYLGFDPQVSRHKTKNCKDLGLLYLTETSLLFGQSIHWFINSFEQYNNLSLYRI
jgi:hypothetical protein